MENVTIKTRENRLRRRLAREGYRLEKTPARSWQREYYEPGYMILLGNIVEEGCCSRQWDATLEEAESFAAELSSR